MSEIINNLIAEFDKLANLEGNEPILCSRMHFADWAERLRESLQWTQVPAQVETVRVRAAVGRDYRGKHYVYGSGIDEEPDGERMGAIDSADYELIAFIEADIPKVTIPTITAAVEPTP